MNKEQMKKAIKNPEVILATLEAHDKAINELYRELEEQKKRNRSENIVIADDLQK